MSRVQNNLAASRFDIYADGTVAGSAHYRMDAGQMSFIYTEVNRQLQVPGLMPALIRGCLDDVHRRRLAILPFCPVVWNYISRHREYLELIPASQRQRFRFADRSGHAAPARLMAIKPA